MGRETFICYHHIYVFSCFQALMLQTTTAANLPQEAQRIVVTNDCLNPDHSK